MHQTGTAVLVSFADIHSLTLFIERLFTRSLRLKSSEQFEIVPIIISVRPDSITRETLTKLNIDDTTRLTTSESGIE